MLRQEIILSLKIFGRCILKRPRILIADDHRTLYAEALTKLVENEYEVVGIARAMAGGLYWLLRNFGPR